MYYVLLFSKQTHQFTKNTVSSIFWKPFCRAEKPARWKTLYWMIALDWQFLWHDAAFHLRSLLADAVQKMPELSPIHEPHVLWRCGWPKKTGIKAPLISNLREEKWTILNHEESTWKSGHFNDLIFGAQSCRRGDSRLVGFWREAWAGWLWEHQKHGELAHGWTFPRKWDNFNQQSLLGISHDFSNWQ